MVLVSNTAAVNGQQRPCRGRKRRDPRRGKNHLPPQCRKQGEAMCQRAHTQKARSGAACRRMGVGMGGLAGASTQSIQGAPTVMWQFAIRSIKCCILSKDHMRGDAGCYQQGIVHGGQKETHLSQGMSPHAYNNSSSRRLLQWKGQPCSESPRSSSSVFSGTLTQILTFSYLTQTLWSSHSSLTSPFPSPHIFSPL